MILRTMLLALAFVAQTLVVSAAPAPRNGQHDFDFQFGTWNVRVQRLFHPLSASATWVNYTGTHEVEKVWGGRANLGVLEVNGPAGRIEGESLRTYDPQTRQWSVTFAQSSDGTLGTPMIGSFVDGRGVFFDRGTVDGRAVLERSVTSDVTATSYRDEYAFSTDGGSTWHSDWIATYARAKTGATPAPSTTPIPNDSQAHDFDFNVGTWRTHIRLLYQPAHGPAVWSPLTGTVTDRKIWGGRASMEEIEARGPTGGFEGLTMFLYDPHTRQWTQTYASSGDGVLTPSMYGQFHNGRGDLVSQQPGDSGAMALYRGVWSNFTPTTHRFVEYVSDDAGKTWHPDFIANLTRLR